MPIMVADFFGAVTAAAICRREEVVPVSSAPVPTAVSLRKSRRSKVVVFPESSPTQAKSTSACSSNQRERRYASSSAGTAD
jgi:hypothetical protein